MTNRNASFTESSKKNVAQMRAPREMLLFASCSGALNMMRQKKLTFFANFAMIFLAKKKKEREKNLT